MVDKKESLDVELQLRNLQEVQKFVDKLKTADKSSKSISSTIKSVRSEFEALTSEVTAFQKALGTSPGKAAKLLQTGGASAQVTNAQLSGQINRFKAEASQVNATLINTYTKGYKDLIRATKNARILALAEQRQTTPGSDLGTIRDQLAAQRIRVGQKTFSLNPNNQSHAKALQTEISLVTQLEDAEKRLLAVEKERNKNLKKTYSTQKVVEKSGSKKYSQEYLQVGRDNTVARITGDGGASVFKIQAQLLSNYLVMSKMFELFNFGTQFVLQLDQAFTQLQAITATSATEMEGLKKELIGVSEQTKFTAVEVAEAATVLGQAGFSTQEIKDSIKDVTLLATAVGTDLKTAVDLTTSTLSIFNLRAQDTGRVSNVLTAAINNSKLTLEKLTLGLQYAGNTAAQAGATFDEVVAILGAMANAGIRSGSTLGTGLRQVIVSFLSPSEKMINKLGEVGLSVQDLDVKSNGLINVVEKLSRAGFGAAQAFESMDVRAASAYLAMANNLDVARDLEQAILLTNAAAEANAIQMESLANSLDNFKSILGTVIDKLAGPFKNFLITSTKLLGSFLQGINKLGPALSVLGTVTIGVLVSKLVGQLVKLGVHLFGLAVPTRAATVSIAALSAATNTASRSFNLLAIGATTAAAKVTLLGRVTSFLGGPIGIITGLLVALASSIDLVSSSTDKLDKARAKVSEANGEFEKTGSNLKSIEDTIDLLINRYDELTKNERALRTEALKVQIEMGALGAQFDVNTASVDELTEALKRLHNEQSREQLKELKQSVIDRASLTRELEKQLVGKTSNFLPSQTPSGEVSRFIGLRSNTTLRTIAGAAETVLPNFKDRINGLDPLEEEDRAKLIEEANTFRGVIDGLIYNATKEVENINQKIEDGGSSYGSSRVLSSADQLVNQLNNTKANLNSYQEELFNINAAFKQINSKELGLTETADNVRKYIRDFAKETSQIKGRLEGVIDEGEQVDIIKGLTENVGDIPSFIKTKMSKLINKSKLEEEIGKTLSDEAFSSFYNSFADIFAAKVSDRSGLEKSILDMAKKSSEDLFDIQVKILNNRKATLEAQVDSLPENSTERKELLSKIDDILSELMDIRVSKLTEEMLFGPVNEAEFKKSEIDNIIAQANKERSLLYEKEADKLVDINEVIKKQVDELDYIKLTADNATRDIDLRVTQLKARLEGSSKTDPLTEGQKIQLSNEIEEATLQALIIKQQALQNQVQQIQELVNKRKQESSNLREKAGDTNTQEVADRVKKSVEELNEAETNLIDTKRKLAEITAEVNGKLGESDVNFGGLAEDARQVVDEFKKNLDVDIASPITNSLNAARDGFSSFIQNVTSGTMSVKQSFKSMAVDIIGAMQEIAAEWVANQLFKTALDFFMPTPTATATAKNIGGVVPRFAGGGGIRRAATGYGNPNRDSVPILARPGEYILRNSAVNMVGRSNLDQINSLGNRKISKGVPQVGNTGGESKDNVVNVYVVAPDQKPSLTAQDVIVTITEDLAKGGATKKLVKSIQMGRV